MKTLHNHQIGLRGQAFYCYQCDTLGKRQVNDVSVYYLLNHVKQEHKNCRAKVSIESNDFVNYPALVTNSVFMETKSTFECKMCLCKMSDLESVRKHINGSSHLKITIAFGNMSLHSLKNAQLNLDKNLDEESWSIKQRVDIQVLQERWSDSHLKGDAKDDTVLDVKLLEIRKILSNRELLYKTLYKNKIGYSGDTTACYLCNLTLPSKLSLVLRHVLFHKGHKENLARPVDETMSILESHKECAFFATSHTFEERMNYFKCKLCSLSFYGIPNARQHCESVKHAEMKNSFGIAEH